MQKLQLYGIAWINLTDKMLGKRRPTKIVPIMSSFT